MAAKKPYRPFKNIYTADYFLEFLNNVLFRIRLIKNTIKTTIIAIMISLNQKFALKLLTKIFNRGSFIARNKIIVIII
jgi:hypothetical protein